MPSNIILIKYVTLLFLKKKKTYFEINLSVYTLLQQVDIYYEYIIYIYIYIYIYILEKYLTSSDI